MITVITGSRNKHFVDDGIAHAVVSSPKISRTLKCWVRTAIASKYSKNPASRLVARHGAFRGGNMQNFTWSDRIGSRSRKAWLLLVRGDEIVVFRGQTIRGIIVVRGSDHEKAGKWSHSTYRLMTAVGVRHIAGRDGWELGTFAEGLREAVGSKKPIDSWANVAEALGVSVPSAQKFLREWRPAEAEKLDQVEREIEELGQTE
jgi:hypothetical protein